MVDKRALKAIEALMALPMPEINMDKVREAMAEHDRSCGLCRLLFPHRYPSGGEQGPQEDKA